MFARLVAPLLFAAFVSAKLTVSTPTIKECEPATFHFAGGNGDIHLAVLPSVDPCAHDPLQDVGDTGVKGTGDYTLHHSLKAGTSVVIVVDDDALEEAWSDTIVVASCSSSSSSSGSRSSAASSASTTHRASTSSNGDTPVNAADDSTSGAGSMNASLGGAGLVALLSAAAFLA